MIEKGLFCAVLAMILWGLGNVLIEQELKGQGTFPLMMVFNGTIFLYAFVMNQIYKTDPGALAIPYGKVFLIAIVVALISALAETLFLKSYSLGVSVYVNTTLMLLIAASAFVFRLWWIPEFPSRYVVGMYACGVVLIWMVYLEGQRIAQQTPPPS